MDHNSQKFPKKICILTKTDIYMEENKVAIQINYKAFEMIQEFNDDPEKQLRLYNLIFKCSFLGEEINDEDMAVRMTAKSILLDIEQCRNNYIEKCKNNAKYGIQGKEFGKLGGRPRKGETKEQYMERKSLENESLISEKMGEDSQWTKMFNEIKQDKELIRQIKDTTLSGKIINDFAKRYGAETALSVIRWILEKYNV